MTMCDIFAYDDIESKDGIGDEAGSMTEDTAFIYHSVSFLSLLNGDQKYR